jgi:hypothetical protein
MILVGKVDDIDCYHASDISLTVMFKIGGYNDFGNLSYLRQDNGFCMAKILIKDIEKSIPKSFDIKKVKWIYHESTDINKFKNIIESLKNFDKKEKTKKRIKEVQDDGQN